MRLEKITASPHPTGNRIDLAWVNPDPDQYPGVRLVRRESTHPTSPEDGVVVAEGEGLSHIVDEGLEGEIMYYYALFPYSRDDPPQYQIDRHNRTAAMATAPYNMAGQMYDLLPGIYHRYDTALPPTIPDGMPEEDEQKGQLRRFLDLAGAQLDQLYSFARAMLDLYNIDQVDGRLLSLLAQWIGWQTDYRQEIDTQRNEIRSAPHVYKTIGIIPTVEATVKRIIGWESRTKEFAHNVFLSNRPERLNIWARHRGSSGEWSAPTEPLSLNFAYEGRPAAVRDGAGTVWLFYHTLRQDRWDIQRKLLRDQWDIWYKTLSTFSIGLEFQGDLDKGVISTALQRKFEDEGFPLSQGATIEIQDSQWRITDVDHGEIYAVREETEQLNVYRWAPSQPLTNRKQLDKHPTAVIQGETLWVFWASYTEADHRWRIHYRTHSDGGWSPIDIFADPETERRRPWAVVDDKGGLWLFWLERVGARWQLKYNRHYDATWELESAAAFPLDDGEDRVEGDPFVLFHPADPAQSLWVFWASKVPTGAPHQTRWQIAYRVKQGIDPTVSDWNPVQTLPKEEPADYGDREPAALVAGEGKIELFWSSNRDRSWSVWHRTLYIATHDWGDAEKVTDDPYSQRDPLPVSMAPGTLLIYRSNESLTYASAVYRATETLDGRYAGCTTVDSRNLVKTALRGQFEDFQTYTYAAGRNGEQTDLDWYARDTVGIYLTPDTEDRTLIIRNQNLIRKVLRQFLPIQVRVVFIIEPAVYKEPIYTYDDDLATVEPQRLIVEQFFDSTIPETYSGVADEYEDTVPGWIWLRSWSEAYPDHRTVDFDTTPIDTRFRTWHIGLEAGGG